MGLVAVVAVAVVVAAVANCVVEWVLGLCPVHCALIWELTSVCLQGLQA